MVHELVNSAVLMSKDDTQEEEEDDVVKTPKYCYFEM